MSATTTYLLIAFAGLIVLLDLWAIVSVFRSDTGVGTKSFWAILISLLPLLGLVAWGVAGPRGMKPAPSSAEHSKG
jgi:hypothetical protein